jgi:PAS domain S-box-containing protein
VKSKSSLQRSLVFPAVAITLILSMCLIGIGYWVGNLAVNTLSQQLIGQMISNVNDQVAQMLEAPPQILEQISGDVTRHHVAMNDPDALAAELFGMLSDAPGVDWLYSANEAGGIVSTGRLADGQRVIMMTDGFRAGTFRQYSATPNGRKAVLIKSKSDFDARTKEWYRGAKDTLRPFWTKPYLGGVEPVLGISLAVPIIGKGDEVVGVYGADLLLTRLTQYMAGLRLGNTGRAFLVDGDGYLIASSGGVQPVAIDDKGQQGRLAPQDASDPVVRAAGHYLKLRSALVAKSWQGGLQMLEFDDAGLGRISVAMERVSITNGAPWLIVSALPASDYLGEIRKAAYLSLVLVAVIAGSLLAVGFWMVSRALRPLQSLTTVAQQIARGKWSMVPQTERNDEIGVLARALNQMTGAVQNLLTTLDERVEASTAELRQQKRYLRTLIDMLPMWAWFKDTEGRFLAVNQAAADARGSTTKDIVGKTDFDVQTREIAEAYRADDVEIMTSRRQKMLEEPHIVPGGTIWLETFKAPVIDEDGTVLGTVGVARDVSERKAAEAAREVALAEAQRLARTRSEFLAQMSHELRTPLNGILGYAQLLLRDKTLGARQVKAIVVIQESGKHLLTLINDILDLARIEAGKMDLFPHDVSLPTLLRMVCQIVDVRAAQKSLAFHCDIAPDLPEVIHVDEKRLRQVLLNLLDNAIKFTDHGQVSLFVRLVSPSRLRFEVQDTGVGIAADQLEAIFEPFEQVHELQQRVKGTGLGLAISRQFVRLLGGDIQVESQPGLGSTFHFELEAQVVRGESAATRPEKLIAGYRGARKKVLVVDDVSENRNVLVNLLSQIGFDVVEAVNGREGVEKAQALQPDLILMDLVMPEMDGLEAIRCLRLLPTLQDVPIVAISASTSRSDAEKSLAAGADAFLPKPVDFDLLFNQIAKLLQLDWT